MSFITKLNEQHDKRKFAFTLAEGTTYVDRYDDKRKFAFTLAEVLITLGIIGVVAAMTLPTLTAKTQDKVLESQQLKNQNILANGYKLMLAKTETFNITNLPFYATCGEDDIICVSQEHKKTFNIIMDTASGLSSASLPINYKLSDVETPSPFSWNNVPYIFTTADGMVIGVEKEFDSNSFAIYTDINGVKGPNYVKKDLFKWRISGSVQLADASRELEGFDRCTPENLDLCDSQAACDSLTSRFKNDAGQCPGIWYDSENGCNIWGWTEWECQRVGNTN